MSAANIRESVKKITPKFAIIVVILILVLGIVQQNSGVPLAEVLPADLSAVVSYTVETGSDTDAPQTKELSAEESAALMELLGQLEFRTNGTADSLRFCYCRVFFETADGDCAELMLTDDMALVRSSTAEDSAKVYGVKPNTKDIQAHIASLFA